MAGTDMTKSEIMVVLNSFSMKEMTEFLYMKELLVPLVLMMS